MVTRWKKFSRSAWTKALLWVLVAVLAFLGLARVLDSVVQFYGQGVYRTSDVFISAVESQFSGALGHMAGGEAGQRQEGMVYYAAAGGQSYSNAGDEVLASIGEMLATPPLDATQADAVPSAGVTDSGAAVRHPLDYPWDQVQSLLPGIVYVCDGDALGTFSEQYYWSSAENTINSWLKAALKDSSAKPDYILVYQPDDVYNAAAQAYYHNQDLMLLNKVIAPCLALLAGVLAAAFWLMVTSGRRPGDEELHLYFIDRWPLEILLALGAGCGVGVWVSAFWLARLARDGDTGASPLAALPVGLGLIGLALLLSLVRQGKARRLWRQSILGRLVAPVVTGEVFLRRCPPARRMALRIPAVFAGCAAVLAVLIFSGGLGGVYVRGRYQFSAYAFLLGCVLALAGAGYLFARQLKDSRGVAELTRQVEAAARGQRTPVELEAGNPFAPACEEVAQMGRRVQESVDARLKSERMKLDLITNVSHDLKTPLTSIIGYVDLLEKQALPAEAEDYVKILRKKADRLNETVQDLFLLAKATSGSEPTPLESRDLVMAVQQVLADMEDAIAAGGIPVRTTLPKTAPVLAESGKLYRVLQNLLDNAERYAMPGTRLYVTVETGDQVTRLTMTNTAAYEMTFTAEEVLQRFVRGDKSRTGDGSGLGLSIAESFMHNFGGELSLFIDGDQFTVRCLFQNAPAQGPAEGGEEAGAPAPQEDDPAQEQAPLAAEPAEDPGAEQTP